MIIIGNNLLSEKTEETDNLNKLLLETKHQYEEKIKEFESKNKETAEK